MLVVLDLPINFIHMISSLRIDVLMDLLVWTVIDNNRNWDLMQKSLARSIILNDLIEQLLKTCIPEFYMLSVP